MQQINIYSTFVYSYAKGKKQKVCKSKTVETIA